MNLRHADRQSSAQLRSPSHIENKSSALQSLDNSEDPEVAALKTIGDAYEWARARGIPTSAEEHERMRKLENQNKYKREQAPPKQQVEMTPPKKPRQRISINVEHIHDPRRYTDKTWISEVGSKAHSKNHGQEESKASMGRRSQLYASPNLKNHAHDGQALPHPASRQSGYPSQQDIAFAASPSSFVDQKKRQSNVSGNFGFGFERVQSAPDGNNDNTYSSSPLNERMGRYENARRNAPPSHSPSSRA